MVNFNHLIKTLAIAAVASVTLSDAKAMPPINLDELQKDKGGNVVTFADKKSGLVENKAPEPRKWKKKLPKRKRTGDSATIKTPENCLHPALEEEYKTRVEFGDEIEIDLTAYFQDLDGRMESSPVPAKQKYIVGRSNIPALNDQVLGMCKGEIRRIFANINANHGIGYIVDLKSIGAKRRITSDEERYKAKVEEDIDPDYWALDL